MTKAKASPWLEKSKNTFAWAWHQGEGRALWVHNSFIDLLDGFVQTLQLRQTRLFRITFITEASPKFHQNKKVDFFYKHFHFRCSDDIRPTTNTSGTVQKQFSRVRNKTQTGSMSFSTESWSAILCQSNDLLRNIPKNRRSTYLDSFKATQTVALHLKHFIIILITGRK